MARVVSVMAKVVSVKLPLVVGCPWTMERVGETRVKVCCARTLQAISVVLLRTKTKSTTKKRKS